MKKNQGYRAYNLHARTNATGTRLTIKCGRQTMTLPVREADELCRWLISVFEIAEQMKRDAINDLGGITHRIKDAAATLDRLLSTPAAVAAMVAEATVRKGVQEAVKEAEYQRRLAYKQRAPKAKKRKPTKRKKR